MASEPTVQQSRQGGTGNNSGRGRGQAARTSPTVSRQGPQVQQAQGQARVFALSHQKAAEVPYRSMGKMVIFEIEKNNVDMH